jgi:hypothetical protein
MTKEMGVFSDYANARNKPNGLDIYAHLRF